MTVVEACVGKKMINPPDDPLQLHSLVLNLLYEGIAQNSTGNVFVAKVNFNTSICYSEWRQCVFTFEFWLVQGRPLDCFSKHVTEIIGLCQHSVSCFLFSIFGKQIINFLLS